MSRSVPPFPLYPDLLSWIDIAPAENQEELSSVVMRFAREKETKEDVAVLKSSIYGERIYDNLLRAREYKSRNMPKEEG